MYEKLDAFLISLSIRESFDQTAFSNKRNGIFLPLSKEADEH